MIEIQLSDGSKIALRDLDHAKEWLENERKAFSWLNGDTGHHPAQEVRAAQKSGWQEIDAAIQKQDSEGLAESLGRLFEGEKRLYLSASLEGNFLIGLSRFNPKVANAAASLLHGYEKPASTEQAHPYQCAAAAIGSFLVAASATESDLLRTKNLGLELSAALAEQLQKLKLLRLEFETDSTKTISGITEASDQSREKQEKSFQEMMDQARGEYDQQKRFFLTELAHLAPVEYWRDVKKRARVGATIWGVVFGLLIVGLALALGAKATDLRSFLAESEHESVAVILAIAISTLAFWSLRMTARIFLSNYHRATDAAERETMVMTFLALRREGHISDDHLSLVLAPLFRPGASGLVKDDAAPEFSAASLLTRDRR